MGYQPTRTTVIARGEELQKEEEEEDERGGLQGCGGTVSSR